MQSAQVTLDLYYVNKHESRATCTNLVKHHRAIVWFTFA
ncbi:hypothetical protein GCHA_2221 [Paraglaciecola chathamensis S18K6]|uniref:Uncharacterized protein n=1 Tax=Paraglaciecola chathamensis S18K6 TaxID=1127672 RepID=A0AAV3UZ62_9ALTE|nr:hypothetical protein GCHA_2221 [Paraglaciecola chathamensis S18K6]